ncbi:alpha-1,3-mannosyl-glycoprotein 4-beta-N-acetylglucosaminyltransferase C [Trichomycterus rosablanca]|uniref:alpha-1,3-mannosyl-glycoprotein 4-beta-N-acetylglucosaminyltransferase C n=1 Tax=Trichomycterus rosablanca TaxID=2290929 RepID=UPI002F354EF0
MRCYLKTAVQTLITLLILSSFYIFIRRTYQTEPMDTRWIMGNFSTAPCSQDSNSSSCPRGSSRVLAGEIPHRHKYLTVGLSSVKRKKDSYLLQTLTSIFSQSSEEELDDMVVVVLLADFDLHWVQQTLRSIVERFPNRLLQGQLLVIHAHQNLYPPLTGLKRNFNDAPDRVTFRSKQNVDYSFLVEFSSGLSEFYLMLEDDVSCSKRFLSAIRGHVTSLGSAQWATLEFSKLGYIGKLYHGADLSRLAQFLLLFYQEMPCDFLLTHFRTLLMQNKVIRFRPSLFQHMGSYSSFRGTYNHLKDDEFQEELSDNPAADIYTDISAFKEHAPERAYSQGGEYFWGTTPIKAGNFFLVVFRRPVLLSRILIQTGLEQKDVLDSADVELGETVVKTGREVKCTRNLSVGSLQNGQLEVQNVPQILNRSVSCLNIRVTAGQENWVIIRNIQVWSRT